jgi:hypothetical protein
MPDASCTRSLVRKDKSKSVQASVTTGLADIRHSLHDRGDGLNRRSGPQRKAIARRPLKSRIVMPLL